MVQQLIMSCSPSDACELTLDPNTANGRLSLSEDNRKTQDGGPEQRMDQRPALQRPKDPMWTRVGYWNYRCCGQI
ncbi:unnamed protein product [Boreogadus saida]